MDSDGRPGERQEGDRVVSESYAAHRRRALTAALAATPARRLAWLEEAIELAFLTGALPRKERPRRR